MENLLHFNSSKSFTIGIELELQLVNLYHYNLVMESKDFFRRVSEVLPAGSVKPEITQSMIEINSSVHTNYVSLQEEMRTFRDILVKEADQIHIGICGGGTHPFQKWHQQRIYESERFTNFSQEYGYLAKQFTVFGQHIHIGCTNADDALYLCHAFARYLPHFIALSASSPFNQSVDTAFDCSRLTVVSAFPLSGTPPWILNWDEFEKYFNKLHDLGVVMSMKDFYWDIRPKPEFGTIEIRICDTPLTIETASLLAGYAQMIAKWLLETRPTLSKEYYLTYLVNRFRTARYGLNGAIIDPVKNASVPIGEDIAMTCNHLTTYANELKCEALLEKIVTMARERENDAVFLRRRFAQSGSYTDVVRTQTELWRSNITSP